MADTPDPADVAEDTSDPPDVAEPHTQLCDMFDEDAFASTHAMANRAFSDLPSCARGEPDNLPGCIAARLRSVHDFEVSRECGSCFGAYAACVLEADPSCFETCEAYNGYYGGRYGRACDTCSWNTGCWKDARTCVGVPVLPEGRCGSGAHWLNDLRNLDFCLQHDDVPDDFESALDACVAEPLGEPLTCASCEALVAHAALDCRERGECDAFWQTERCYDCLAPHVHTDAFVTCSGFTPLPPEVD